MSIIYPLDSLKAHPSRSFPGYKSTAKRSPTKPLVIMPHTLSELTGPVYGHDAIRPGDNDLTTHGKGEPLGERIIVHGHVLDEDARPVPDALVEIWQTNAAGRYIHVVDQHPAPLDPNFTGAGRTVTDKDGYYKFITIKPGAYPWGNHHNAWRPAHIHFSLFGHSFLTRLVTQMYFPGDPLLEFDPISQFGHRSESARAHDLVVRSRQHRAGMGAGLPLRHRAARPQRHADGALRMSGITPSQTVGPFFAYGLTPQGAIRVVAISRPAI